MTKHPILLLAALLVMGSTTVSCAQTAASEGQSIIYYTPKQNPQNFSIWIDDIEFAPNRTIVTMHYLRPAGGANLAPSTRLICHLRGGKTKVLDLQSTCGISMKKNCYTQLGRGEVFRAYFPALAPSDVAKIKSIDFMEVTSGFAGNNVFNITDIKINKKQQVIR